MFLFIYSFGCFFSFLDHRYIFSKISFSFLFFFCSLIHSSPLSFNSILFHLFHSFIAFLSFFYFSITLLLLLLLLLLAITFLSFFLSFFLSSFCLSMNVFFILKYVVLLVYSSHHYLVFVSFFIAFLHSFF